jgi:NADH-quinone oxidoreductase subunit N
MSLVLAVLFPLLISTVLIVAFDAPSSIRRLHVSPIPSFILAQVGVMASLTFLVRTSLSVHQAIGITSIIWVLELVLCLIVFSSHKVAYLSARPSTWVALAMLACVGAVFAVVADTPIAMILGIEILSLALYALLALPYGSPSQSQEAGLKYFIASAYAGAWVLFGLACLYFATNAAQQPFSYEGWARAWLILEGSARQWLMVGFFCFFSGLWGKLALVPWHMWAPDVYGSAQPMAAGFGALLVKITAISILQSVLFAFQKTQTLVPTELWNGLLGLALVSILYGNALALRQKHLRRLLGYSSIAHSGYVVLYILSQTHDTSMRLDLNLGFFWCTYAVITLGLFFLAGCVHSDKAAAPTQEDTLKQKHHFEAFYRMCLRIFLCALAGLPPTAGFIGKVLLLQYIACPHMLWPLVGALGFSIIGAIAYLRMAIRCPLRVSPAGPYWPEAVQRNQVILGTLVVFLLVAGVFPQSYWQLWRWWHGAI